jgi:hypothetical protein
MLRMGTSLNGVKRESIVLAGVVFLCQLSTEAEKQIDRAHRDGQDGFAVLVS